MDTFYIEISDKEVDYTFEVDKIDTLLIDYDKDNKVVGIEIIGELIS